MTTLSRSELIAQLLNSTSENGCNCHFIDANKTRVLMWKHKTLPNTYFLKVGEQLLISSYRTDKNGETYWKYRNLYEKETENKAGNPLLELRALETEGKETFNKVDPEETEPINHERNNLSNQAESTQ